MQFLLVFCVQTARGLIGKDDGRIVYQCSGNGYTLLLTAGELVGLVSGTVGQSHELKQFTGTFPCILRLPACDIGRNHDVLQCGKLREKLMELEDEAQVLVAEVAQPVGRQSADIHSVYDDRPAVGLVQCAEYLQQSGLSGSGRPDDADDFAFVNVQVDAFQHLK